MSDQPIVKFSDLEPDVQELIIASDIARSFSYAPYSNYKVGAAIRCRDGTIIKGCNVENASYPASVCAETTAIAKAVSEGKRKYLAIAVIAEKINGIFTFPCGVCRQTISEFGDIAVYITDPTKDEVVITSISILHPLAFKLT